MRDAAVMIAAGTLIALPAVWALRRFVEAELFGVTSLHLPTIAIAGAVLAVGRLQRGPAAGVASGDGESDRKRRLLSCDWTTLQGHECPTLPEC